jgi:hemoglobin
MSDDLAKLHAYYREGDNQYRLAGGVEGITKLANDFYDMMETLPEARRILFMHPADLTPSRDKLARFLCGYLNGPDLFGEKYGVINLGPAHARFPVGTAEKEAWLLCMEKALEKQDWPQEFREFLLKRLQTPAERIRNRP